MIFKRINNPKKSARKAERIRSLADYIVAPEKENGMEKCIYAGALGFVCNDFESQKAEMIALAATAVRSRDPINHYMLSWREDERPTPAQVDEAVAMFVRHLGLEGHQVLFGLHDDTNNQHIHIVINRVHPLTGKVIEINNGFDREAGHQAIALIEERQGWSRLKNSRYIVNEQGEPERRTPAGKEKAERQPTTEKRDRELQHGEKSAERIAQEIAGPLIRQAGSWQELHALLAEQGMRYERKGSGALIYVGDVALKASNVDRQASFSAMQKRLGLYQERRHSVMLPDTTHLTASQLAKGAKRVIERNLDIRTPHDNILHLDEHRCRLAAERRSGLHELPPRSLATERQDGKVLLPGAVRVHLGESRAEQDHDLRRPRTRPGGSGRVKGRGTGRTPEPLAPNQPAWAEYVATRDARKADKARDTLELQQRHEAERNALFARLKAERTAALARDWRGAGMARNALASLIAAQQAREKVELRERHADERKLLQAKYRPMPPYREWKLAPAIVGKIAIESEAEIRAQLSADKAHRLSTVLRQLENEQDWRGRMVYRSKGVEIFRDEGRRLAVLAPHSDEAIAVALAHAQQKFGRTLTLTGDQAFQRRVVAVAVAQGMNVRFVDPTLEALRLDIKAGQTRSRTERPVSDYDRIQAWKKEKRAAERAAAAKTPPGPAQAPAPAASHTAEERQQAPRTVEEWLAAHPEYRVRHDAALPMDGNALYVADDGRWVQNCGRGVAVRLPSGIEVHAGAFVCVDKHGVVTAVEQIPNRGKTR